MPRVDLLRSSPVYDSFRVQQVSGMFDMPPRGEIEHRWNVSIPFETKPWKLGLITGASGSGKTSIAKELFKSSYFHESFEWSNKAALIDGFPEDKSAREITQTLNAVGLSSPPHWLKPYTHLSNGQKFRADLARCLMLDQELVVYDEFTSVVDRDVAKICSSAISKTIKRRPRPQFVAVSCHSDIIDWLQPDWVYDVGTDRFEWRSHQRRPPIRLELHKADRSSWLMFRGHHYLSGDCARSATCYVATWNGRPVAFCAVMHFPLGSSRRIKRGHRTVVLPDFQGVGIGNAVSEAVAARYVRNGWRYMSLTAHPAMIAHRTRSPVWKTIRAMGFASRESKSSTSYISDNLRGMPLRLTATFEYVGKRNKS